MQKIKPFLWFDGKAEEAANFYVSIFANSRIIGTARFGDAGPGPKGSVMTVQFQLDGQEFNALNGEPQFKFNEAISFTISCKSQQEVDHHWSKLSAGGQESRCGWLKDQFGVSWQVVPTVLIEMLQDRDPEKSNRVTQAMFKMRKIEIQDLEAARDGS